MNKFLFILQTWLVKLLFPAFWFVPTKLLLAQSQLETGNFTSAIFLENNNAFGMKHPQIRESVSEGSNRGHAVYRSVWHSIYDYFLRQKYFKLKYKSPNQYVSDTAGSGYAEDPDYSTKWLTLYKQEEKAVTIAVILFGVMFIYLILNILKKWLNIDVLETIKLKVKRK